LLRAARGGMSAPRPRNYLVVALPELHRNICALCVYLPQSLRKPR
jgi:hypothetical protein